MRRVVVALSAVALSTSGFASLGTGPSGVRGPALASNWAEPLYNPVDGVYIGCMSKATGYVYLANEITELGCNTDIPLAE